MVQDTSPTQIWGRRVESRILMSYLLRYPGITAKVYYTKLLFDQIIGESLQDIGYNPDTHSQYIAPIVRYGLDYMASGFVSCIQDSTPTPPLELCVTTGLQAVLCAAATAISPSTSREIQEVVQPFLANLLRRTRAFQEGSREIPPPAH